MYLPGGDGSFFALHVMGYEFPEKTDYWDANWLNIHCEVGSAAGNWSFSYPCLMVRDVHLIAEWFEALSKGQKPAEFLQFVEPNLEFQRTDEPTGFKVYFELEARPPWNKTGGVGDRAFWVQFSPSSDELVVAANELRSEMEPFPLKGDAHDAPY